jgi:hypothetical protein
MKCFFKFVIGLVGDEQTAWSQTYRQSEQNTNDGNYINNISSDDAQSEKKKRLQGTPTPQ